MWWQFIWAAYLLLAVLFVLAILVAWLFGRKEPELWPDDTQFEYQEEYELHYYDHDFSQRFRVFDPENGE